jgi:hypothetical protein
MFVRDVHVFRSLLLQLKIHLDADGSCEYRLGEFEGIYSSDGVGACTGEFTFGTKKNRLGNLADLRPLLSSISVFGEPLQI